MSYLRTRKKKMTKMKINSMFYHKLIEPIAVDPKNQLELSFSAD